MSSSINATQKKNLYSMAHPPLEMESQHSEKLAIRTLRGCSHLANRDSGNEASRNPSTAPKYEKKTVEKNIEEMMASLEFLNERLTLV